MRVLLLIISIFYSSFALNSIGAIEKSELLVKVKVEEAYEKKVEPTLGIGNGAQYDKRPAKLIVLEKHKGNCSDTIFVYASHALMGGNGTSDYFFTVGDSLLLDLKQVKLDTFRLSHWGSSVLPLEYEKLLKYILIYHSTHKVSDEFVNYCLTSFKVQKDSLSYLYLSMLFEVLKKSDMSLSNESANKLLYIYKSSKIDADKRSILLRTLWVYVYDHHTSKITPEIFQILLHTFLLTDCKSGYEDLCLTANSILSISVEKKYNPIEKGKINLSLHDRKMIYKKWKEYLKINGYLEN